FLYRDASGLANLYVHQASDDGAISFASKLALLLAKLPTPPSLSRVALHEYLRFGDIAAPRTIYDNVHSLEPGQLAMCSGKSIEFREAPALTTASPATDFDAAIDQLETLLNESVASRLAGAS